MKANLRTGLLYLLVALGTLAGCGAGSGAGLNDQGLPVAGSPEDPDDETPEETPTSVTLAQLQEDIFAPICSQCHTGSTAPQGLRLDSEQNSYDSLVNQPSQEVATLNRVTPGDAENSYIVHKVEGRSTIVGGQMPLGGPPLDDGQVAQLRDWIDNGAPRTGNGDTSTGVALQFVEKIASAYIVTLHFSRPVQPETLNQSAVQVYLHENGDRWLAGPDTYALDFHKQTLAVLINEPPPPVVALEVLLNEETTAAVLDINGRLLDGDGDNTDGGSHRYVYNF